MSTVLFWFRNDLRLHDQPALHAALTSGATHLLPVVCLPAPDERTPWGFARVGSHRRAFTAAVDATPRAHHEPQVRQQQPFGFIWWL